MKISHGFSRLPPTRDGDDGEEQHMKPNDTRQGHRPSTVRPTPEVTTFRTEQTTSSPRVTSSYSTVTPSKMATRLGPSRGGLRSLTTTMTPKVGLPDAARWTQFLGAMSSDDHHGKAPSLSGDVSNVMTTATLDTAAGSLSY